MNIPNAPANSPPQARENPTEQHDCEESLHQFIQHAWPILEPVQPLQWNWHLDLICEYLTLVRDNEFRKPNSEIEGIIFNVPPRTMKSLLITVMFPVWVWTRYPARRFMFVSILVYCDAD